MNNALHTPPITKNLLFINIVVFLACTFSQQQGIDLNDVFGLHFFMAPDFHLWQLVSYMFMHASLQHIFFNMFALWMFGRVMEQTFGQKNFLIFYFVCGIGAGLCQEVWQLGDYYLSGLNHYTAVNLGGGTIISTGQYLNLWTTVGASGAIYGILLGFGMSYPEERILIFPIPFPIKAKWFVTFYAAIEAFSAFFTNDNTAHFAHLGGMLFAFILIRYWQKKAQRQYSFSGWDNYRPPKKSFVERLRENIDRYFKEKKRPYRKKEHPKSDDANSEKVNQAEIDKILEKVRNSGYSSLTEEEKKKLFDQSRRG